MTTEKTKEEQLQEIGRCAMDSIREMVAALECDYERLEELREARDELKRVFEEETRNIDWNDSMFEDAEELKELEEAAGECTDREDAEQRIHEDPLSIEVRSDWVSPGEEMTAGEFLILLSTGGPATRIIGELDEHGEPCRARLEAQDWFTPWTEYITTGPDHDALLIYARCFCFQS